MTRKQRKKKELTLQSHSVGEFLEASHVIAGS